MLCNQQDTFNNRLAWNIDNSEQTKVQLIRFGSGLRFSPQTMNGFGQSDLIIRDRRLNPNPKDTATTEAGKCFECLQLVSIKVSQIRNVSNLFFLKDK